MTNRTWMAESGWTGLYKGSVFYLLMAGRRMSNYKRPLYATKRLNWDSSYLSKAVSIPFQPFCLPVVPTPQQPLGVVFFHFNSPVFCFSADQVKGVLTLQGDALCQAVSICPCKACNGMGKDLLPYFPCIILGFS